MSPATTLVLIKLAHTVVWAALAGIILIIPWFVLRRRWRSAAVLIVIIFVECAILAANHMRCPLTDLAARYTTNRDPNFDIYLPLWLARNNKLIFGSLFAVELIFTAVLYSVLSVLNNERPTHR